MTKSTQSAALHPNTSVIAIVVLVVNVVAVIVTQTAGKTTRTEIKIMREAEAEITTKKRNIARRAVNMNVMNGPEMEMEIAILIRGIEEGIRVLLLKYYYQLFANIFVTVKVNFWVTLCIF